MDKINTLKWLEKLLELAVQEEENTKNKEQLCYYRGQISILHFLIDSIKNDSFKVEKTNTD